MLAGRATVLAFVGSVALGLGAVRLAQAGELRVEHGDVAAWRRAVALTDIQDFDVDVVVARVDGRLRLDVRRGAEVLRRVWSDWPESRAGYEDAAFLAASLVRELGVRMGEAPEVSQADEPKPAASSLADALRRALAEEPVVEAPSSDAPAEEVEVPRSDPAALPPSGALSAPTGAPASTEGDAAVVVSPPASADASAADAEGYAVDASTEGEAVAASGENAETDAFGAEAGGDRAPDTAPGDTTSRGWASGQEPIEGSSSRTGMTLAPAGEPVSESPPEDDASAPGEAEETDALVQDEEQGTKMAPGTSEDAPPAPEAREVTTDAARARRRGAHRPWLRGAGVVVGRPGHRVFGGVDLAGGVDVWGSLRLGLVVGMRSATQRLDAPDARPGWDVPLQVRVGWAPDMRVAPRLSTGIGVVVRHLRHETQAMGTYGIPRWSGQAGVAARVSDRLRVFVEADVGVDLVRVVEVTPDGAEDPWSRVAWGGVLGVAWTGPERFFGRRGDPNRAASRPRRAP
jgi:hypothetical protein